MKFKYLATLIILLFFLKKITVAQDTIISDTIYLSKLYAQDTYVTSGEFGDNNYSNSEYIEVTNTGDKNKFDVSRSYIYFDIKELNKYLLKKYKLKDYDIDSISLNFRVNKVLNKNEPYETYLSLVGENWNDSTVAFTSQPQIVDKKDLIIGPTHETVSYHSYDITSHIRELKNHPDIAYGWQIRLKNEVDDKVKGVVYHSMKIPKYQPFIVVRFLKPVQVFSEVSQCKNGSDGAIELNEDFPLANFYRYDWYDHNGDLFSNNRNVSGLSAGLYYVTVSNTIFRQPSVTKFFIITCSCEIYNFSIPLSEVYTNDAMTKFSSGSPWIYQLFQNYGNSTAFESINANFYSFSTNNTLSLESYTSHSYMKFDNFEGIDANDIYRASLTLKNNNSSLYPDGSMRFENLNQSWSENTINLINSPSLIPGDYLDFSHDANYASVDMTQDFVDMFSGNLNKYGYRFKVQFGNFIPLANSYFVNKADYFSSNNADEDVPVLDITIGESCVCAVLKYEVDGNYFVNNNGQMCVFYENEYNQDNVKVRIYEAAYETLVATDIDYPHLFDDFHFGENKLIFDFRGDNCLCGGKYIMEIENEKGEIKYLKFINKQLISCCELEPDPNEPDPTE